MHMRAIGAVAAATVLGCARAASGQCEPGWSDEFTPGTFDGTIQSVEIIDGGSGPRLVVAGSFSRVGGSAVADLASWDGAEWHAMELPGGHAPDTLGAGTHGDTDRLYAWSADAPASLFVRAQGVWSALPPIDAERAEVRAILPPGEGDGEHLFVCGTFEVGGRFAPLMAWDGEAWLAAPTREGTSRFEHANDMLWVDDASGGSLYVGGCYSMQDDYSTANLVRWDGTRWHGTGWPESLVVDRLECLGADENLELFAIHTNGVGRLADGAWTHVQELQMTYQPSSAVVRVDGVPEVVWTGTGYPDGPVALWRWNSGELGRIPGVVEGSVCALVPDERGAFGGGLVAAGRFWSAGGVPTSNIAQLRGGAWQAFAGVDSAEDAPGALNALYVSRQTDPVLGGRVYVGGCDLAGGRPSGGLAAWDGEEWQQLGQGVFGQVTPISLIHGDLGGGGRLIAGGEFTINDGTTIRYLGAWDGTSWSRVGALPNRPVRALVVTEAFGHPMLFAAGDFSAVGSVPAAYIAAYDGVGWHALGEGLDGIVHAMAMHDDGTGPALYVAGEFTNAGGAQAVGVARWNGTGWSAVGAGLARNFLGHRVTALTVAEVGGVPALYAGGFFNRSGVEDIQSPAVWNGVSWKPLGHGLGAQVSVLQPLRTSEGPLLLAGGEFSIHNGEQRPGVAVWDGAHWTPFRGGADGPVRSISAAGSGFFMAGEFASAGGVYSAGIAGWGCTPLDCLVDWNGEGVVDTRDVVAFLSEWAGGSSGADFDRDGDVDQDDVLRFVAAWRAGC